MRTALVTGACINTGVAIVEKLLSEGWRVVFTGRNMEKVLDAEAAYKAKFPEAEVISYAIDSLIQNWLHILWMRMMKYLVKQ